MVAKYTRDTLRLTAPALASKARAPEIAAPPLPRPAAAAPTQPRARPTLRAQAVNVPISPALTPNTRPPPLSPPPPPH